MIKLSTDISNLPPKVQERLLRLQQLQESLQSILTQKQQVDMELTEIDQALSELQKVVDETVIYKSIGSLLVKVEKPTVTMDLKERKELLNMRSQVLGKQEDFWIPVGNRFTMGWVSALLDTTSTLNALPVDKALLSLSLNIPSPVVTSSRSKLQAIAAI